MSHDETASTAVMANDAAGVGTPAPRAGGRGCSVCASAHRRDADLALAAGEPIRSISLRLGLSVGALHRHKAGGHLAAEAVVDVGMDSDGQAHIAPPAPTTLPEPVTVPGCPICIHPERRWIDNALTAPPIPDLHQISRGFDVAEVPLRAHWSHASPLFQPPVPPQPVPKPAMEPPPHGIHLPVDRDAALLIIGANGQRIVPEITAWARRRFQRFCRDWSGPPGIKDSVFRRWQAECLGADPANTLVATVRFVAAMDVLAGTDGDLARSAAALAAVAASAPLPVAFSAGDFIRGLTSRGLRLSVTAEQAVIAAPRRLVTDADRAVIAQFQSEIAHCLNETEVFHAV